ncbi:peptidase M14 carboxypeptidase A [Halorubrum coriense DSM 10284]|uniref:Peptidase M14 carboxypeptidase A n=1 Tax=Halorubrum coriense DSM 10284 TaxID=1227466 RepID=M0EVQ9_9EURY|nr:hypothetical protein [Halorubrum coriense]ELZ50489.1 peptidase M14 carboxypeptidase A [Halorubrum coriense DSM 10284]
MSFDPAVVDLQIRAYKTTLESFTSYTGNENIAIENPAGEKVALIDGDSTRATTSELPYPVGRHDGDAAASGSSGGDAVIGVGATETQESVPVDEQMTVPIKMEGEAHRLTATVDATTGAADVTLYDPSGAIVRTADEYTMATAPEGRFVWGVNDPVGGTWELELSNERGDQGAVISIQTRSVTEPQRDPRAALGYNQRDYDVSITDVAPSYRAASNVVYPAVVRDPNVVESVIDHVNAMVVPTDTGIDRSDYVESLNTVLTDEDRTVVLTDSGVQLLGESKFSESISEDAVQRVTRRGISLGTRNEDHSLLEGTQPGQRELARSSPLGYASTANGVPVYGVDRDAFEAAGGSVAGYHQREDKTLVTAGTIRVPGGSGEVVILAGLLPSPTQQNLHPFGLSLTHLGYTVLANGVGHAPPSVETSDSVQSN